MVNKAKYAVKALSQVIATIVAAIMPLLFSGADVNASDWVNVAITGVGAFMVFAAPNVPGAMYTKAFISGATAALTVLASLLTDGITGTEIAQIVLAFLGTAAVALSKNDEPEVAGRHSVDNVRVTG